MILHSLNHRGRWWTVVVHPAAASDPECRMELIFAAEDDPAVKQTFAVENAVLEWLISAPDPATELRGLLERAADRDEEPPGLRRDTSVRHRGLTTDFSDPTNDRN